MAALALPSPLVAGDRPDPGVLRADDGEYVAVTTSNGWAPTFRVMRSPDLVAWRTTGAVFRRPPRWAQTLFWAPEMIRLGTGYALFYSALPRDSRDAYCLGVATAPAPEGPWRDRGRPLRCGRNGSIDAHPTRDESGRLHLLWKSNANRFRRRTTIFAQRLREDGKRLLGRPRALIRNDRRWEGRVVEAPTVLRRPDGYLYMLYSADLCCTKRCRYSVGVARSRKLFGPWRKFEDNPILEGGNGWSCPGHTGVVDDGAGGSVAFFHAYREGAERLAGRQLLAAPLTFGDEGWPAIGEGRPPPPAPGAAGASFQDDFSGPLAPEWEWPLERVPGKRTGDGLLLTAARKVRPEKGRDRERVRPRRIDGGVLSRRVTTGAYAAIAVVDTRTLRRRSSAGVSSFRSGSEAVGVAVERGRVLIWSIRKGRYRALRSQAAPRSRLVHLRMVARGRRFRFESSPDGRSWRRLGPALTAPVQESARVALTVGGERRARARFVSAELDESREPGSTGSAGAASIP